MRKQQQQQRSKQLGLLRHRDGGEYTHVMVGRSRIEGRRRGGTRAMNTMQKISSMRTQHDALISVHILLHDRTHT